MREAFIPYLSIASEDTTPDAVQDNNWDVPNSEENTALNRETYRYALNGEVAKVEDALRQGASLNDAVEGYAEGGYIDQVNSLILRGANIYSALQGYNKGNLNHPRLQLRLLASTDDPVLRSLLIHTPVQQLDPEAYEVFFQKKENLLSESNFINRWMRTSKFSFDQVISLMKAVSAPTFIVWVVQGSQLIYENKLSREIYFHITEYLITELSAANKQTILEMADWIYKDNPHVMSLLHHHRFFSEGEPHNESQGKEDCSKRRLI